MRDRFKAIKIIRLMFYQYRHFVEKKGYLRGKENSIVIHGIKIATKFIINGNNNSVYIDTNAILKNCVVFIHGNNNTVNIKKNCFIDGATFHIEDNNCSIVIGENIFVGRSHLASTENNSSIIIGNDCMLSSNINIRTGDSHSIIDLEKETRINYAQSIKIGDHCWVGEGAKILKGVSLGKDVIVATGAIVTCNFQNNVLIGGIPAKIIRGNVTWDKNRIQ